MQNPSFLFFGWLLPIFASATLVGANPREQTNDDPIVLRVLTFHDPQSEALFDLIREFEQETGILVEMDQFRSAAMMSSENLPEHLIEYDLVTVDEPYLLKMKPHILPYKEWPEPKIFQEADITKNWHPKAIEFSSIEGTMLGIPVNPNVYFYTYRKDLFEDEAEREAFQMRYGYELAPPRNATEFRNIADFFHRPPTLYGFSAIDEYSEAMTVELIWALALFGQRLCDKNLQPVFDPAAGEKALNWYRSLIAYSPAKRTTWNYDERTTLMKNGRLAQGMFWPAFLPEVTAPASSQVSGLLGFSLGPRSSSGEPVNLSGSWTIAIPRKSTQTEEASEFAFFWAAKDTNIGLMRRSSSINRRDMMEEEAWEHTFPWTSVYQIALERSFSRPKHSGYHSFSQKAAALFHSFLNGDADAEETVRKLLLLGKE